MTFLHLARHFSLVCLFSLSLTSLHAGQPPAAAAPAAKTSAAKTRKLVDFLPQLQKSEPVSLKPGQAQVRIILPKGWKINEAAPSWLALFDLVRPQGERVQEFSKAELFARQVALKGLQNQHSYRLQGTLYYCEDVKSSVCLIQSVNQRIQITPDGTDAVSIPLQLPTSRR